MVESRADHNEICCVHATSKSHACTASSPPWPTSRPRRNIQSALHRRPRQAALEPAGDVLELVEGNEFTRAVEADQIAYPAEHGNVGDGVVIVQKPLPAGEIGLHHAKQPL